MSFSRNDISDQSKMVCISRRDDRDKNIFVEKTDRKSRWNLYSQIAICATEAYDLTEICSTNSKSKIQHCTLMDTNEVVEIGNSPF